MYDQELDKLCVMDTVKFEQALEQGACDVVDAMLSQGYVPDTNSIAIVCRKGHLTLLQTLLHPEKYDINVQVGLFAAVRFDQTHLLDYLFLAGANINLPDENGNTVLHIVTNPETCKWLLDMGAQYTLNNAGHTPLRVTCFRANSSVVDLILSTEQGLQSLSLGDNDGNTPLYWACIVGTMKLVQQLLSYDLGVQSILVPNHNGNTPLHAACWIGHVEVVKLLLTYEQGVQTINRSNKCGETPLDKAKSYSKILALLQNAIS